MKAQLQLAAVCALFALISPTHAASISKSTIAPAIGADDIANYGSVASTDKWFYENSGAGAAVVKTYASQIAAPAVRGASENTFAGIADDTTWSFTAVNPDTTVPTISTRCPADNANLVATFNLRNDRGTANASVRYSCAFGIADPWESALIPETDSTENDVVFDITPGITLDAVQATIPASKASSGKFNVTEN